MNDVSQQLGDTETCPEARMFLSTKPLHKSRSFGLLSENMLLSYNVCCNPQENEELRTGAGESKEAVVRTREVENALDEVMLLNKESKLRETKSCICVLRDAYRHNDHADKLQLNANTKLKVKDQIAREYFVCNSEFLGTARLLDSEDSRNRSPGRAETDLGVCSENITRRIQKCAHNLYVSCDMCRKHEQRHDLWWSPEGCNRTQESMECKQNYKKQKVNRFLPRETKSDTIFNTQNPPVPNQMEEHHKQAGVLMTTICDTSKTEHGFVHCTQSVCCLSNEEIYEVYYSANNLHTDMTARDEMMDSCIVSAYSSAADAVLTKSNNPERSSHCKHFSMKLYSLLDGDKTKAKECGQWRKEEIHENKLDKLELKVDIAEDHKVPVINSEVEESNCERFNRNDKSDICMFEKVYEGKDELDKLLHNTNSTLKEEYGVVSEQCINCESHISDDYYTSDRRVGSTRNILCNSPLSKLNLETISREHVILEEIVTMFNSQDLYKVLDKKVIQAFKNYFSHVTLLILANRNKSGNSGYSPMQYQPGVGNTRKKCKKPDPTMYVDEGNRSQKLQSCLEKVRLACALHNTIGHMRNRFDHHAAVMAYEQSIKDLEISMKNFLELNVGNTKVTSLSEWHPQEIDNSQRRTRKGAKHKRGQNALRRSETFVVDDPCSHKVSQTPKSKRDVTDLCVQKVCNQEGQMSVNGNDAVNNVETFLFSSDSSHSVCFSPALLSTDTSFQTLPISRNRLYFHRRKVSRASKHSSLDSRNADSQGIWVSESRYRSKSHDSDFGTSECLSLPESSGEQEHRSLDLTASLEKLRFDKINERAQSNNKETTLRCKFNYVNINGSTLSDVGAFNDELEDKARPKYSAGNTYLCTSLRLPKVPDRSQSLNYGNIISQNDKCYTEPSVSNKDGEVKKHIKSISDVYLPNCDPFCSVNNVTRESCYHIHKHKIIPEFLSLQPLTQKKASRKDNQDTAIIDTRKMALNPALNKDVNDCSREHDTYSNVKDKRDSVNDTCRQEYHTSSREQTCLERSPCNKHCFLNDSSSVQLKSSQACSSHISVGSHKKWRLPHISRENTLFQLCSDMFPPRTDWPGSDGDDNDDLQVDFSPNDMIHHCKSDVNTTLDELNRYAQRRKKNRTLFQKRATTNTPSWVDNAENVAYLNNKSLTPDTNSSISCVKYGYSEGAHTVYQNEKFTTYRDNTVTGERKCTHLNLTDSQNMQALVSVSQPVDTVNKEGSKLYKYTHTRNEKSLDVVENGNCEPTNNDWSKTTDNKNNARFKDPLTKLEGNISRGTSSPERYIDASSSLSTKSSENVRAASQSCKESTSETGFKSNNFESKFTASSGTCCSLSMPQSHETGFVSDAFITLTQTLPEYEEAGDFSVSELSSNILASTSISAGHSCSQEHESSASVSTLVLSKSSSCTLIDQSFSGVQTSKVTAHNSERDDDNETWACSKKMNGTEQRVREISVSQPKVIQLPYPFCFVSLKDEQQFVYQGAEDMAHDQNRSKGVKQQYDNTSSICHTGETEAETFQLFSVISPPKCVYSGSKKVNCSYLISISANPVILNDKEMLRSAEVDGKGTFPFLIVGDDLDSSSQDENDTADFAQSARKRTEKHALNIDSSNDVQFNDGSKSSVSRHDDEHVVKDLLRTRNHNKCVPQCITTKCQHTNNDPLIRDCQIVLDRRGDFNNKRRSTSGIQSLHTDLWESEESRSQSPGSPKENVIIKHLSDKVKYLESMLEFIHFTNYTFQRKNQNIDIDSAKDLVLPKQPYHMQCVAAQQLDQTQLTSGMHYSSNLHPGCCIQTTEPSNPGNPESYRLRTPCRCVQNACSLYPVGYHWEDSKTVGRVEDTPCISTACQTEENSECSNDTRLRPCSLVDSSTQYDADLSGEGAGDITKLLPTQMAQIHADIQAMKRDALLGSFQSLRELVSDQRRELREMSSKMETITSSLECGKDGRTKKGEDPDTMKARILELTSQRDAEKMFHKITRQALRSLERDHDRLRQEFFHANCRRFRQGERGSLEGKRNRPSYQDLLDNPIGYFSGAYQDECSDLFVTVQVFNNGLPITLPIQTSYKSFTTRWNWNEWLTLPIKFSDLPRDTVLAFTIWDYYGIEGKVPIGGTVISVFGKRGTLRKGMHDLKVWSGSKPDPQSGHLSKTPGKSRDAGDRMSQLAKLTKKHRDGHMTKIDWLDRLTFREIELVNEQEKRDSTFMYLMVEFPHIHYDNIPYTLVYYEKEGDKAYEYQTQRDIVTISDPEIALENIVESKHHKLARSLRSGPSDKDLKPDASTRDLLNKIIGYPPTKTLSSEEQDLVWKFRFYLSSQKEALAKFLKSVNWKLSQESTAALEMLMKWSPMNVEDALELLSPAFSHTKVRKYAVMRLRQADDEDLLLYLLQLVQALKYEDFKEIKNRNDRDYTPSHPELDSHLAHRDSDLPSLVTEPVTGVDQHPLAVSNITSSTSSLEEEFRPRSSTATEEEILDAMNTGLNSGKNETSPSALDEEMDLATFLISRACKNPVVANYFYWYLLVECEDHTDIPNEEVLDMYKSVLKRFSVALSKGPSEFKRQRSLLSRQQLLVKLLCSLVQHVQKENSQKKKLERLQARLHDSEFEAIKNEPIPLPLDPSVLVKGVIPEKASVFSSKLSPCLVTFQTYSGKEYKVIFKYGDDLRQDQLILQMFQLMDKLLRHENLDLQMTPYKVLATGKNHGFVQYVESIALSEVSKEKAIQKFLRQHNPSETGPYGIAGEVMDNYVKSCAGYCVVTYLLQVGDRHLDNLLLTKTGKMFHIDFGFILGRDPKIMAPPMKLNRQMVEAMGGYDSEHFQRFKVFTYTAFLALRRSANLFLNLFSLMVDSNIPDIALEPDKTVKKVQEKFMLHLNDEQAVQYIQGLIDDSVNAFMPTLMEYGHKVAQALRK